MVKVINDQDERNQSNPRISFRAGEVAHELNKRIFSNRQTFLENQPQTEDNSLGLKAKEDLKRYYFVLREDLSNANKKFSLDEMKLLVLSSSLLEDKKSPNILKFFWAHVVEVIDKYEPVFNPLPVKKSAIVSKIRGLTYGEIMSIFDASERAIPEGTVLNQFFTSKEVESKMTEVGLIDQYHKL